MGRRAFQASRAATRTAAPARTAVRGEDLTRYKDALSAGPEVAASRPLIIDRRDWLPSPVIPGGQIRGTMM